MLDTMSVEASSMFQMLEKKGKNKHNCNDTPQKNNQHFDGAL